MKTPCPNEETLADYLEDRLSDDERPLVEAHFSGCEVCLDAFVVAKGIIREVGLSGLTAVPAQVTDAAVYLINGQREIPYGSMGERIRDSIKGACLKLSDGFTLTLSRRPHLVPVRGKRKRVSGDLVEFTKTFRGIKAQIEIQNTGNSKAHIRINLPERDWHRKGIRVTLRRAERDIISSLLDEGYVLFEDISFGHYNLIFSRDGTRLGTYPFEIKESCHGRK